MLKPPKTDRESRERTTEAKRAQLARMLREKRSNGDHAPATLHRRFEAQVDRTPDAIALVCENERLTYRELNARANRLAHHLRSLGVGHETLVGLCVERSAAMIVGILGILKAGGAYVPLDTVYPRDRLAFLADDSAFPVLVTEQAVREHLPEHSAYTVCLDSDWDAIAAQSDLNLPEAAGGESLAYVIYTSGSTGRPKGVPVTHANVARLFDSTRRWFHFDRTDVWTLFHSFAFDFSVWEIWGALLYGGRLVVVPYWVSRSPDAFAQLLRDESVTILNQTPSAFRQLIRAEDSRGDSDGLSLRLVIFGGEALEPQTLRPWFERYGDQRPQLVNMYGITETTVHVTYRPITLADLDDPAGSSPIGRAIPDLRLYVLDRALQPVPVGVAGEIYVGGAGVARGYLSRPGLTATRFIPDPFSDVPGARLYKSGDLARWRADGQLDYLGRSDHQVKIRGFRIELGEIESAIVQHPTVREAVVLARGDAPGGTRLAAYLVPRNGHIAPTELRRWLQAKLPEYMVPAAFAILDALPLTPNGKVDRDGLPAPRWDRSVVDTEFVAPRTATEKKVAEVWTAVLGVDRVGAFDEFFDLGGHSLLATQVLSRLRETFALELPLRILFEAQTVAALAERIELAAQAGSARNGPPIVSVPRDQPLPLSFSQQALWFLDRLAPGQPTFNVGAAVKVVGPLDEAALERSFLEIVRRHEVLRTTFAIAGERPVQVISPTAQFTLGRVDLLELPPEMRGAEAARIMNDEGRKPFDLARGPLFRACLLRLGPDEHAVILTTHHIITDGWSLGVAARELAALYEAFRNNAPSPLPDLTIQYADFATWQRRSLEGNAKERLLGYWSERLADVQPLELPTDRPRPAVRSARGAIEFFSLTAELSEKLNTLARRDGVTPFMLLLAAFQTLLHRYSGQDDFVVGSPIANRNRAETEGLIGYFVNMLALRANLAGNPSFREFLARVRETSLGAFEHQELPLEVLVESLHPQRDLSRTPLFQVMFVLQNNLMPVIARDDLTLLPLDGGMGTGTAKFDLTLAMEETPTGFIGSLEYALDLFDASTITRMIEHFRTLLEGIVADPEQRLEELPLASDSERYRVLESWSQTKTATEFTASIHELFEAQVERTPDAIAIASGERVLSYRDLNAQANQVASFLKERGIGCDSLVGIATERSNEFAVGLLGILKSGAAYVPLDPAYPKDRLTYMLRDTRARIILTQKHLAPLLRDCVAAVGSSSAHRSADEGVELVQLDADWNAIAAEPPTNLAHSIRPGQAAYVIYTSGSTGEPRGVIVTHGGMLNHAVAMAEEFGLHAADRVLQFSSPSFDIAVEEIFPTWIRGAAVVFRGSDCPLDAAGFSSWVAAAGITVLDLPTAYWHAWISGLSVLGKGLPDSLRLVVVGGEKALPSVFATWRTLAGSRVRWLNTYGPTETTVVATLFEPGDSEEAPEVLPIGRPIAGTRVYVLDAALRAVPCGLPGELCIGGAGVARGYLNRPGPTAERFVPSPFGPTPGERLFRTGDLVRWRSDGELEFLGRLDDQVKIRGFRIEPGEIEAAILRHPDVQQAAVVAYARDGGELRLAAYVVATRADAFQVDSLRRLLHEVLPAHLIPSTITLLPELPLTPSGKVDRRSLPTPHASNSDERVATPPRDAIEERLSRLWEEVLDVRPIGVTDNFFDLGGSSLSAVRLVSRIESLFGRTVPLSTLFQGASIEELAVLLRDESAARPVSPLVLIQPQGEGRPFYCVHPAGGTVLCFRDLARELGTDRPFYALQATGLEDDRPPDTRVEDMAARYVEAILEVQPAGPYHLGGWSLGGIVAFEMAQRLRSLGHEVATVALIDAEAPKPNRRRKAATPDETQYLRELIDPLAPSNGDTASTELMTRFVVEMAHAFGGSPRSMLERLRKLTPDEQRAYLMRQFGIDEVYQIDELYRSENGSERVRRLWNVLRTGFLAGLAYAPRPLDGPIILFKASQRRGDSKMGWGDLATEGVNSHVVRGDHASILKPPSVRVLAQRLRDEIDRSDSDVIHQ